MKLPKLFKLSIPLIILLFSLILNELRAEDFTLGECQSFVTEANSLIESKKINKATLYHFFYINEKIAEHFKIAASELYIPSIINKLYKKKIKLEQIISITRERQFQKMNLIIWSDL